MKAMNLYFLTRETEGENFSGLVQELSGRVRYKEYSRHEAQSLRMLTELLIPYLIKGTADTGRNWVNCLDGFHFSYTIAHISKEFDLLKISADGKSVLNIELKSEDIGEDRILKQLMQNRYYLTHISGSIYSFTYVMETNTLYYLNDKGHMRTCDPDLLASVLQKPAFVQYVEKDLDLYFRAADYLIDPVTVPEKYLQGNYFLTNQQAEFKRKILETLRVSDGNEKAPVIVVEGGAATGKSLLLYDLAMELSKKKRVLFLYGGKLSEGHRVIDERLKHVDIFSAAEEGISGDYAFALFDEANRAEPDALVRILDYLASGNIPCILACDPNILVKKNREGKGTTELIREAGTRSLEFTGNIRVNRPAYLFLRAMMQPREIHSRQDFDCIDVLYAANRQEAEVILAYYREDGFSQLVLSGSEQGPEADLNIEDMAGQDHGRLIVVLDSGFYYDEDMHLQVSGDHAPERLSLMYEGISRTRERLCVLVVGNEALFTQILSVRER